jgi:hypothetical protein
MEKKEQKNSSEQNYLFDLSSQVGYENPPNTFRILEVIDRTYKSYPDNSVVRRYFIGNNEFNCWVNEEDILSLENLSVRILDGTKR